MAFQLSPGVNITEIDLTTIVPAVATSDGAISGLFRWGPVGERILVDSENILIDRFGKPTNYNAETWFSAANFLSYTNRLWVSRAANTSGETPHVLGLKYSILTNKFTKNGFDTETAGILNGYYVLNTSNLNYVPRNNVVTSTDATSFSLANPIPGKKTTAIITHSSPAIVTVNFDVNDNDPIVFTSTGNLPSPLVSGIPYFIKDKNYSGSVCTFNLSLSSGGDALATSSDGSGIHTARTNFDIDLYFGSPSASYSAVATVSSDSVIANLVNQIVKNQNEYHSKDGNFDTDVLYVAKYPGAMGNSLRVAVCDNEASYNSTINIDIGSETTGNTISEFISTIGSNILTIVVTPGTGGSVLQANTIATTIASNFAMGDKIKVGNSSIGIQYMQISADANVTSNSTAATVTLTCQDPYRLHTEFISTTTVDKQWEFFNVVGSAPSQSKYQALYGNTAAMDELHVVVVDDGGQFTGTPGTILEVYKGLSRATDAKNVDNTGNYYKDVINQNSKYIWFANDRAEAASNTAVYLASSTASSSGDYMFTFGTDGFMDESDTSAFSVIASGYDLFASSEDIDVSLIIQGRPLGGSTSTNDVTVENYQLSNYIIDNITDLRKDCVAFISPDKNLTLNAFGTETTNLTGWRSVIRSSSYAVMDTGYKYQYDRYNDVYRWIPLNGDIAGLCARTDSTNDAWWSPAGFNRGQIKNLVKLAYNPRKAERDILYVNGINPVVAFPGQGTVLYGDKTLQAKPSAFDHINVRRLFIVLEKAISVAAKYSLFEFNDQFTQNQFKNLVNPYLRGIKGKRGITDFLVVCDSTNNTPAVVDANQFVGDIYIKPARSINFIQLNFVAVATGVQFSEVVGKF
jgi:hypothetical protein